MMIVDMILFWKAILIIGRKLDIGLAVAAMAIMKVSFVLSRSQHWLDVMIFIWKIILKHFLLLVFKQMKSKFFN
jgi:hypothetical protein